MFRLPDFRRFTFGLACLIGALDLSQPAAAQFYWSPPDLSAPPLTDEAATTMMNLPGANEAEIKAGLVWHLRAALNVAALQCQFEPTLLSASNYNATIAHHDAELDGAMATLLGYFQRTVGKGKPGQSAFDQYGTRIYSAYSTVQAQRGFCQTAASVGRDAIFADRGKLNEVARADLGSIRRSLIPVSDQYYTDPGQSYTVSLPALSNKKCWKKGRLLPACQVAWEAQLAARAKAGS